jgi:hypothetical protein
MSAENDLGRTDGAHKTSRSVPHACGPDPQRESKDQSLETRSPRRRRNVAIAVDGIYEIGDALRARTPMAAASSSEQEVSAAGDVELDLSKGSPDGA